MSYTNGILFQYCVILDSNKTVWAVVIAIVVFQYCVILDSNKTASYIVMSILVSYCRNCHNDNYDEALDTNMKINVNIKLITRDEAEIILSEDRIKENIDKILGDLSNKKYLQV